MAFVSHHEFSAAAVTETSHHERLLPAAPAGRQGLPPTAGGRRASATEGARAPPRREAASAGTAGRTRFPWLLGQTSRCGQEARGEARCLSRAAGGRHLSPSARGPAPPARLAAPPAGPRLAPRTFLLSLRVGVAAEELLHVGHGEGTASPPRSCRAPTATPPAPLDNVTRERRAAPAPPA